MSQAKKFGKWRSFFWPVHDWELKKFLPMLFMFFLIAFNYNLLRSYKDSLVITANHSGAEIIPFIKVWAVLPSAILLTFIYTRISNAFDREKVFYITISIFLVFFSICLCSLSVSRGSPSPSIRLITPRDLAFRF